jgi:two-component system phosphate regulon sensor histidine kinase PhoR
MSARFWVQDHGPGIPAEEHEKIFERFYRCGSELRRQTQGVGIGLSIVKHVVEAHGGRVRIQSQLGQGSRFTIELPHASNCGPSGSNSLQPVDSASTQFQKQQRVSERRPAQ